MPLRADGRCGSNCGSPRGTNRAEDEDVVLIPAQMGLTLDGSVAFRGYTMMVRFRIAPAIFRLNAPDHRTLSNLCEKNAA